MADKLKLIDQYAIKLLESDPNAYSEEWNADYERGFLDAVNKALELPTIEAEPVKHGKWENDKLNIPRCSCCSYIPEFNRHIDDYYYSDFCPNCGARMGGGSE